MGAQGKIPKVTPPHISNRESPPWVIDSSVRQRFKDMLKGAEMWGRIEQSVKQAGAQATRETLIIHCLNEAGLSGQTTSKSPRCDQLE